MPFLFVLSDIKINPTYSHKFVSHSSKKYPEQASDIHRENSNSSHVNSPAKHAILAWYPDSPREQMSSQFESQSQQENKQRALNAALIYHHHIKFKRS